MNLQVGTTFILSAPTFGQGIQVNVFDSGCGNITGPWDHYAIAELLGKAYLMCQTGSIAVSGFKVTEFRQCDRNVFTDTDFLASRVDREKLKYRDNQKS